MSRSISLLLLTALLVPCGAVATTFTQSTITGDLGVLNDGTLIEANNLGAGNFATTINGVAFGDGTGAGISGFTNGGGDFSTDPFSSQLDTLLSSLVFEPSGFVASLSINGLTIGQDYRLQLFTSNDANATGQNQSVRINGVTHGMGSWIPGAINLTVDFTATSTTAFTEFLDGGSRAILNGYALHQTSAEAIPAPMVGIGLALLAPLLVLRRRHTHLGLDRTSAG